MRVKMIRSEQRKFLKEVMSLVGAPSLRELSRRIDLNYSTLKNYFIGVRLLPKNLFENLCEVSGIRKNVIFMENNWGQIKGGKKSKRN